MASKRIRFQLSYIEGAGSELERALALAGVDSANLPFIGKLLTLGALSWAQGAVLSDGRDGLRAIFPGQSSPPMPVQPPAPAGHTYEEPASLSAGSGIEVAPGVKLAEKPASSTEPDSTVPHQKQVTRASDSRQSSPSEVRQVAASGVERSAGQGAANESDAALRSKEATGQGGGSDKKRGAQEKRESPQPPQGAAISKPQGASGAQDRPSAAVSSRQTARAEGGSSQGVSVREASKEEAAPQDRANAVEVEYSGASHEPADIDMDTLLPRLGF